MTTPRGVKDLKLRQHFSTGDYAGISFFTYDDEEEAALIRLSDVAPVTWDEFHRRFWQDTMVEKRWAFTVLATYLAWLLIAFLPIVVKFLHNLG